MTARWSDPHRLPGPQACCDRCPALVLCTLGDAAIGRGIAIYERITVAGPRIVSARLTQSAHQHGLALALQENVRARATGVERAITTCDMPIESRDEWFAVAARHRA